MRFFNVYDRTLWYGPRECPIPILKVFHMAALTRDKIERPPARVSCPIHGDPART
jgi:hypothetical protein